MWFKYVPSSIVRARTLVPGFQQTGAEPLAVKLNSSASRRTVLDSLELLSGAALWPSCFFAVRGESRWSSAALRFYSNCSSGWGYNITVLWQVGVGLMNNYRPAQFSSEIWYLEEFTLDSSSLIPYDLRTADSPP